MVKLHSNFESFHFYTLGSSSKTGSSLVTHGRCGEPNGLYAVRTIPTDFKYALSLCCVKYGWHSTWLVTGLMRQAFNTRCVCDLLKLETPILFTRPASTAFSNSRHVSRKSTEEKASLPSGFRGKKSSPSLYANGKWIRYKSTYGVSKFFNVVCNAGNTRSGRWCELHNLLVRNRSSLKIQYSRLLLFATNRNCYRE